MATATAAATQTQPTTGQLWIRALRAPFLVASIVPYLLGTVLAVVANGTLGEDPLLKPPIFLLGLAGVVFFHLATNMFNDNFDFRSGNDLAVRHQNPFAGGGRVLTTGGISVKAHLAVAATFFAAASLLGLGILWLVWHKWGFGPAATLFALGTIGWGSVLFYVGPPLRLAHRGVGELVVGTSFGPLIVIGAFLVQTGTVTPGVLWPAIAMGLLVGAILWINEFPDIEADTSVGKRTLVARLGPERALRVYEGLLAAAFAMPVLAVALRFLLPAYYLGGTFPPLTVLIALAAAPLAVKAIGAARANYRDPMALIPANAGTIGLTLVFGILLVVGTAIGIWLPL